MKKNSNEFINSKELIESLGLLEEEKGIKKEFMIESIEVALLTAYKRNYDCVEENIDITLDRETGEMHVYIVKDVVDEIENDKTQITVKQAGKYLKNPVVGDIVKIEIAPKEFGRIAAQTAKQVIIQKIREASREVLFDEFSKKKGEIISGIIQKADGGVVVIDLGKLEGIMTVREQVQSEKYKVNDKIRVYITDIEKGSKGDPQVMVSRVNSNFVKKLFEIEIPEIKEGFIEIKSVSRDPGSRSKVAVYSQNPNIDPVGSCVGQRGIRIQNIIKELNGEKIDVIEWSEDSSIYIAAALLPAEVLAVDINEEEKSARVVVPDSQLSLAIGKSGQNVRLAANLTGWKIDIKNETQIRQMLLEQDKKDAKEVLENTAEVEIEDDKEEEIELVDEIVGTETVEGEVVEIEEEKKPAKRGRKKKEEVVEEETAEAEEEKKPAKRGRKKKEEVVEETAETEEEKKPAKRGRKKKEEVVEETVEIEEEKKPAKRGRKKKEESK